jgi:hypothetical protein
MPHFVSTYLKQSFKARFLIDTGRVSLDRLNRIYAARDTNGIALIFAAAKNLTENRYQGLNLHELIRTHIFCEIVIQISTVSFSLKRRFRYVKSRLNRSRHTGNYLNFSGYFSMYRTRLSYCSLSIYRRPKCTYCLRSQDR